jgi:hypothetical protein
MNHRCLWMLSLVAFGCSTWTYSLKVAPAEATEPKSGIHLAIRGEQQLIIENGGSQRAFLVWDSMSAVLNGVQRRAYKGSQKVFLAEQSIPPQPIEPGATLSESFVVKEVPATTVSRARPVVPILDIPLCILYGIGCLVADLVWAPDEQYKREVLPPGSAETQLYELLVPLRFENGETKVVHLPVISKGMAISKNGSPTTPPDPQESPTAVAGGPCANWASASAVEKKRLMAECHAAPKEAPPLHPLDEKNGFRDLKFGDRLPDSGFVEHERRGRSATYGRPSDTLRIGGAGLASIEYHFYDGAFAAVTLHAAGPADLEALREALTAAYGDPYRWVPGRGPIASTNVELLYDSQAGTAVMTSVALRAKEEAEQRAAAKSAAGDL